jgi:hypothetical protein
MPPPQHMISIYHSCNDLSVTYYKGHLFSYCSSCITDVSASSPDTLKATFCGRNADCIDLASAIWYCPRHSDRCDGTVKRPRSRSNAPLHHRCPQRAMFKTGEHWFCEKHCDRVLRWLTRHMGPDFSPMPDGFEIVPEHAVASGPPTTYLNAFSTVSENKCPICLENCGTLRELMVCGHKVCAGCLARQVNSSHKRQHDCPMCRRAMSDLPAS